MDAATPDYDLPATLAVGGDDVHRALADPRRRRILALLSERAATARQLGVAIERSQQATIHHLDVLREAGLVRVVRTQPVRATEQRWWGRTARVFLLGAADGEPTSRRATRPVLEEAAAEYEAAERSGLPDDVLQGGVTTIRYARIDPARVAEWRDRLIQLTDEFTVQPRAGDTVHGLVVSLFPTAWRPLDEEAGA